MKNIFYCLTLFFFACQSRQQADLIIHHGKIYTVDSSFSIAEAIAIKNGKMISVGSNENILKQFDAKEKIDLQGKFVYPGFIDAHCHFLGYGIEKSMVDLTGTKSFNEVIGKIVKFSETITSTDGWIQGRGWDQNDWEKNEFPTKDTLDRLFPNTPVFFSRVDGHAALVNQKAMDLASVNLKSKVDGGSIEIKNGRLTGILIDNAMDLVVNKIPDLSGEKKINAILLAQKDCFEVGLTTVDDAGLSKSDIDLMDSLQKIGLLKMRIYAMANPSEENLNYYFANGKYKTERMNIRSFKIYADGALGSRGACLILPYSDKKNHFGFLINPPEYYKEIAKKILEHDFQMNTHAIGDSGNRLLLNVYEKILKGKNDKRWRMEHCQVLNENEFSKFGENNIIPSVQPTHATSDMYWAEDRLGNERVKNAYAYKKLLQENGMIASGTDFPVEKINPLYTFFAATSRQDDKNFPAEGFQMENALTREETLKSMTIWAAYSNFEEKEKGSIEVGKFADFVVLEEDIMQIPIKEARGLKVKMTFVNGEKVFAEKKTKLIKNHNRY